MLISEVGVKVTRTFTVHGLLVRNHLVLVCDPAHGGTHLQFAEAVVAELVHQAVEKRLRAAAVDAELALRREVVRLLSINKHHEARHYTPTAAAESKSMQHHVCVQMHSP